MSYKIEAASKEEWAERALSGEKKLTGLKDSVRELFSLLDATEETDEGRVHRPVQIVCVRTDMLIKLENVLATLKSTMEEDMKCVLKREMITKADYRKGGMTLNNKDNRKK